MMKADKTIKCLLELIVGLFLSSRQPFIIRFTIALKLYPFILDGCQENKLGF